MKDAIDINYDLVTIYRNEGCSSFAKVFYMLFICMHLFVYMIHPLLSACCI